MPVVYADYFTEMRERVLAKAIGEWVKEKPAPKLKRCTLYYTDPSQNSDKEYQIVIERSTASGTTTSLLYDVTFGFGKRGTVVVNKYKTTRSVSLNEANRIYDELVSEKKKKGYTTNPTGVPFS